MSNESEQRNTSRYYGYEIRYLKELLKDIDKEEDYEFWDEIKTIIVCKEFEILAEETRNPNHVKKSSGKVLPGEKNRGYRSGAGFYTK